MEEAHEAQVNFAKVIEGFVMAHPRVFISSTYYDLKNVRADIERYIKDRGFDPVLNERGHIPYGNEKNSKNIVIKRLKIVTSYCL